MQNIIDDMTIVLPSARAIRHEQLQVDSTTLFLPNYITMSDFITKLCIVEGYKFLDEESRILLLLEASDFQAFANLEIERNFFTFTKNSAYIFKFFEELSAELYDINNLSSADLYAEYEEHITILQELYKRYEALCGEQKLLDRIFLPKLYTLNESYLKRHPNIEIYLDGYLTNFELELLQKATQFSEIKIHFTTTAFNTKMQERLRELGFEIEEQKEYLLDFNNKTILTQEPLEKKHHISCESFSEPLLQIAFIKQKIYEFVQKGYRAEKIAVILPNEVMAQKIRSFDEKANLNFAMGEPYTQSSIYKKLHATMRFIEDDTCENDARLERVGDALYLLLHGVYKKQLREVDFEALMQEIMTEIGVKQEVKIFQEELHKFMRLLPMLEDMKLSAVLSLFMQRLASRSMDDVRGGKVTVMGVLETRSVAFDGVIIIDFDDKNVPKRSEKDMFLNTQLREIAGLPTMSDRENLQKHYYEMLMRRSREVAIAYVEADDNRPSRFLKQLGIKKQKRHDEKAYASLLFHKATQLSWQQQEIIEPYSFQNIELSNSRLSTFLSCKRKYYYKYVQKIQEHTIARDMPEEHEIGTAVHAALRELYSKKKSYSDAKELQRDLERELDSVRGKSELEAYLISLQKKRLIPFCEREVKRFNEGWQVYRVEESLKENYHGMTLIGQIDRIDKKENLVSVLDYKTGSYKLYNKNNFTQASDFQLEFYYILAGGIGNVESCAFYDLKESKIVEELFLEEKLAVLESHIKDLLAIEEVNFSCTEDLKNCQYCPYVMMCGRDR